MNLDFTSFTYHDFVTVFVFTESIGFKRLFHIHVARLREDYLDSIDNVRDP